MSTKTHGISIIIPLWNEQGSIQQLVERIDQTLRNHASYEIIAVDDHSTDRSIPLLNTLSNTYPIQIFEKQSVKGKAQSIYEGLAHANYDIVAMIDADLQYPPEALLPMMEMIMSNEADVIVANRTHQQTSAVRQFVHNACRVAVGKMLHGFDCDIQSGLKVFRREVRAHIHTPSSAWAFDLEFLIAARRNGYAISHYNIIFSKREADSSKINMIDGAWQIGLSAVKLKLDELRSRQNAHV
jgi:dolichol-phosphate mannosyltransferase